MTFYLIDNPASDKYPTPKDMVEILDSQKEKLDFMLDSFDLGQSITGIEVYTEPCLFHSTPTVTGESDHQ